MSIKVTVPNNSGDYLTFGSANTPTSAQIGGYDDGSSNGHLEFYTTASGTSTERMRIDSSGNVGIGVTPSTWASGTQAIQYKYYGSLWNYSDGSFQMSQNINYDGTNWKYISTAAASNMYLSGGACVWQNAPSGTAGTTATLTERMRLTSAGSLLVGDNTGVTGTPSLIEVVSATGYGSTSTAGIALGGTNNGYVNNGQTAAWRFNSVNSTSAQKLNIDAYIQGTGWGTRASFDGGGNLLMGISTQNGNGGTTISGASSQPYVLINATATTNEPITFRYNGTTVGRITQTTSATSYVTSSDYRLKEDVLPMARALDKIAQLKPVTYKWKVDGSNGQGFIAHELQAVVPDCVVGEKDAVDADGNPVYQGIDTSFLVATLTCAIQELKAELDTVKTELATLKGQA